MCDTMAFKRVGDDFDSIKVQKKFRVSELLLEDIPDDEATLMKNGRFACLVCRHNPVFDTVAVLSIHRQGKKHLANAKIRLEKLREDAELRQKRAQENYLKNSKPDFDQGQEEAPLLTLTQKRKELALTNLSGSIKSNQGSDQPVKQKNVPFFQSRVMLDSKFSHTCTRKAQKDIAVALPGNVNDRFSDSQKKATSSAKSASHTCRTVSHCSTKEKSIAKTVTLVEASTEERAQQEHIARLTRDGWIRDWNGKWRKDENVEFDSDEDEPPPMP